MQAKYEPLTTALDRMNQGYDVVAEKADGVFLTGTPEIAWRYSQIATCLELVHDEGSNVGLVVVSELDEERVIRLSKEPPADHVNCIGFHDGWWVEGSVGPDEIVDMQFREFEAMKHWRGVWNVYRTILPPEKHGGEFKDWSWVFASQVLYRQMKFGRTDITEREEWIFDRFSNWNDPEAIARAQKRDWLAAGKAARTAA